VVCLCVMCVCGRVFSFVCAYLMYAISYISMYYIFVTI
jgi:hypothetical protein